MKNERTNTSTQKELSSETLEKKFYDQKKKKNLINLPNVRLTRASILTFKDCFTLLFPGTSHFNINTKCQNEC
jgi:hypothetical protein